MTYMLVPVMCLKCGKQMTKQGKDIYFCTSCCRFYRLKGMLPVCEEATYEDAQKAMAEEVAEDGLATLVD